MEITTITFWGSLLEIFIINLILSGDNAVVIALATLHLKEKDRRKGIFWGTFGAVSLRIGLTVVAVYLLLLPYIQAIGGLLLLFIALKLLTGQDGGADGSVNNTPYSLKDAIKTIIIADLLMSMDNVLAVAGAAGGNMKLLMVGLIISIPIVIFGSTFLSALMRKFPWLVYAGAGLLGYTGGGMILSDSSCAYLMSIPVFAKGLPWLLAAAVIAAGHMINTIRKNNSDRRKTDQRPYQAPQLKGDILQESFVQAFAGKKDKI